MARKSKIDSKAFEVLVREHHRRLLAYTVSLVGNATVAQDIVQDSLLVAYLKLDTFDTSKSFPAWVRGICLNKYREWCRKNCRYVSNDSVLDLLEAAHEEWDDLEAERNDSFRVLRLCIETLSDTAKQVVDLFYMKGKASTQLADELNESEPTIRKRLQRARESLARCVTESLKAENRWGRS